MPAHICARPQAIHSSNCPATCSACRGNGYSGGIVPERVDLDSACEVCFGSGIASPTPASSAVSGSALPDRLSDDETKRANDMLDLFAPLSISSTWEASERRTIVRAMLAYGDVVAGMVNSARDVSGSAEGKDVDALAVEYAAEYVMSTEGADYEPTQWERALILDALHGFVAEHRLTEGQQS